MRITRSVTVAVLAVLLAAFTVPTRLLGQEYQPSVGQQGKDVIWVPTPDELIAAMLDMAKVKPTDYVIDLGSGDGRIVIAAAKRGSRALGIEYNPDMVELSKSSALKEGVSANASFIRGDIFEADFSKASVITMYLLPDLNLRLRPKILEMRPGTRVVSHAFTMDDWAPDDTVTMEERTAYLWIVPAKVAGTWTWNSGSGPAELTLRQTFQKIEGSMRLNGRELPIQHARLVGDRIEFSVGEGGTAAREFGGRVNGGSIDGNEGPANHRDSKWTALRRDAR